MFREGNRIFLTEDELTGAILHYLRAQGPAFYQGLGEHVIVNAAPVTKNGTRYDFVVRPEVENANQD